MVSIADTLLYHHWRCVRF